MASIPKGHQFVEQYEILRMNREFKKKLTTANQLVRGMQRNLGIVFLTSLSQTSLVFPSLVLSGDDDADHLVLTFFVRFSWRGRRAADN